MSLEHRSGRWFLCYYPQGRAGGKKRLPIPGVTTREEAQVVHDSFMAKNNPSGSAGYTVANLWPDYMAWYQLHRSPTTYANIQWTGKIFIKYFSSESIEHLGVHHINYYKQTRLADGVSNRTVNKELAYFSGFLKWCRRNYNLNILPFPIDKLPYKRPFPTILTINEVIRIMECAEPFYRCFFLFLYCLGLRLSEARNIRYGDIDFQRMTVKLMQKGGSYKILPIPMMIHASLMEIMQPGASLLADKYVFSLNNGESPIYGIRKALKRAVDKAGIKKRVYAHLFRHSVASHLMSKGVHMRVIQKYLGHVDIQTTQFYTHVAMSDLQEAGGVVAGLLDYEIKSPI